MISAGTHFTVLVLAALCITTSMNTQDTPEIDLVYSEELGDQMIADTGETESHETGPVVNEPSLPPVEDPIASPPPLVPENSIPPPNAIPDAATAPGASFVTKDIVLPQVGFSLDGRSVGSRSGLLGKYGGNATTEAAVQRSLKWLIRQQRRQGNWSLLGPYSDAGAIENEIAATAMAMLAIQGAGHTHLDGLYERQMKRASKWICLAQDKEGSFWNGQSSNNHRLYAHAMATMAICELYGMTRDESLRAFAQKALDYSVRIQDTAGGWRYEPGYGSDTSVTGWFVMALQSGLMAGLEVPSPTLLHIHDYLDSVASEEGAQYGYLPNHVPTPAMTAEGLLCRQYLGWDRRDNRLCRGIMYLLDHPITADTDGRNAYYWYYATQVLHHVGGPEWDQWNRVMRQSIPKMQSHSGKNAGSWDPEGHPYGQYAGRLYVTCLSTYILEVYYRHLPLYKAMHHAPTTPTPKPDLDE